MGCELTGKQKRVTEPLYSRHISICIAVLLLILPCTGLAQEISAADMLRIAAEQSFPVEQGEERLPIKCGFPAIIIAMTAGGIGASGTQVGRPQIPFEEIHNSPGGSFQLHYTTVGVDSVPGEDLNTNLIPDYIEAAAASLDSTRSRYIQLGWRTPVSDGDRYDVYFLDLEGVGWFGYTQPIEPVSTVPPYTAPSYMVLENDYPEVFYMHPPLESMRVTVAHEYHHAIQLAYSLGVHSEAVYRRFYWFAEASAVYHEEILYDGINDYLMYLPSFLNYPHYSLITDYTDSANHAYGAVLWPIFMDAIFGSDANRGIWTLMADEPSDPIEAHRSYLVGQGTALLDLYGEFSIWLLHTGDRADPGNYFPEGAAFPEVLIESAGFETEDITLPALAVRYYRSATPDDRGGIATKLTPSQRAEWGAGIGGETGNTISEVSVSASPQADPEVGAGVELFDWLNYTNVIRWYFTGDNLSSVTGFPLDRTASHNSTSSERLFTPAAGSNALLLHQNYPNPFRPGIHSETYFSFSLGSQNNVLLEIRSLSGNAVWSRTLRNLPAGQHFTDELDAGWDGRDRSGKLMPSGVYILIVNAGGQTRVLKFSLVR